VLSYRCRKISGGVEFNTHPALREENKERSGGDA
jgi:hypothetical protein